VLVQKVLPYTRKLSGDALAEPVRRAISLTYESGGEVQEAGVLIARVLTSVWFRKAVPMICSSLPCQTAAAGGVLSGPG